MRDEEEESLETERKRPVRLSRSGLPVQQKQLEEQPEEEIEAVVEPEVEDAWEEKGTRKVPQWLLKVGAIGLPILGVWLIWTVALREKREDEEAEPVVEVGTRNPEELAQAFLEAETVERRLALTYRAEEIEEQVGRFAEEARRTPTEFTELRKMPAVLAMGELRYHRFLVDLEGGGQRLLCVVETPEGMRVDWGAFARHGDLGADGTVAEEGADPIVRVFIKSVRYYNYSFSDERAWVGFELHSPEWSDPMFGYARRDSSTARILVGAARRGGAEGSRVTLRIRMSESDPDHRQFVIEKVLAVGWVIGERDLEGWWKLRRASPGEGGA